LSSCGVEVAVEVGVAGAASVGHVDVGHLAAGKLVDLAAIALDPVKLRRPSSSGIGTTVTSRAAEFDALWVRPDADHGLPAGGTVEELIKIVGGVKVASVNGEQVLALLDVDARQGKRRGEAGGPVLAAEDFGDLIAVVIDGVIGAQEADLGRVVRVIGTADEHVADGDFAEHFRGKVGEFGARGEVVEVGLVFCLDFGDAEAVGVGVVEEVALDAPGFVVDLTPLGARDRWWLQ
jgi:hypothetical protein